MVVYLPFQIANRKTNLLMSLQNWIAKRPWDINSTPTTIGNWVKLGAGKGLLTREDHTNSSVG